MSNDISNNIIISTLDNQEDYIFINQASELESVKVRTKIIYYCIDCNKLSKKQIRSSADKVLLCKQCKTKRTCLEKYGVSWTAKIPSAIEKNRRTVESHGGYTLQRESSKEKFKQTMIEKYGVEHPMLSEDLKDKLFNTNISKYGHKTASQSEEIKEKIKQTNLGRYGETSTLNTEAVRQAREQACINRYGTANAFYSIEARRQKFYKKDGILFDSAWELYFYLYHVDVGNTIIREPIGLNYTLKNGKSRIYFPDFMVNNQLYEIKGDQFFNDKGEPFCKLTGEYWWEKYHCMIENKVIIIKQADIDFYKKYIINKFGFGYISQFMISSAINE